MADEEEEAGAPLWMCTFSDMMSLLLCFFVLLFAMSTVEKKKWIQAAGALAAGFGGGIGEFVSQMKPNPTNQDITRQAPPESKRYYGKDSIISSLKFKTKTWQLDEKQVEVLGTEKGISFIVAGDALFDATSATIRPESYYPLQLIADSLLDVPSNPVRIVGHTDDRPPVGTDFASNWELSAARAHSVLQYIAKDYEIPENRFSYEGAADTQPRKRNQDDSKGIVTYFDNAIPEEAAMNRRIEVILLQTDENRKYGWYAEFKKEEDQRSERRIQWDEPK